MHYLEELAPDQPPCCALNERLQKYKAPTEKYIVQDGGTVLLLPAGLTDVQLKQALLPYEKYKVRSQQNGGAALLDRRENELGYTLQGSAAEVCT